MYPLQFTIHEDSILFSVTPPKQLLVNLYYEQLCFKSHLEGFLLDPFESLVNEITVPCQGKQWQVHESGPSDLVQSILFLLDNLVFLPHFVNNELGLILELGLGPFLKELLFGSCEIQPPLVPLLYHHFLAFHLLHFWVMIGHYL